MPDMIAAVNRQPEALNLRREAALIFGGVAVVALCARINLPLDWIPVTGQTFGVLLVGASLGCRRGFLSLFSYLCMGAAGLPLFASGGGVPYLVGPTGGYLLSYPIAAGLVGWLADRGWTRRMASSVAALAIGMIPIYLLGVAWFSRFVGWEQALTLGMARFLVGDALKIVLAALLLPGIGKFIAAPSGREHSALGEPDRDAPDQAKQRERDDR